MTRSVAGTWYEITDQKFALFNRIGKLANNLLTINTAEYTVAERQQIIKKFKEDLVYAFNKYPQKKVFLAEISDIIGIILYFEFGHKSRMLQQSDFFNVAHYENPDRLVVEKKLTLDNVTYRIFIAIVDSQCTNPYTHTVYGNTYTCIQARD